jgi:hypothetical protein
MIHTQVRKQTLARVFCYIYFERTVSLIVQSYWISHEIKCMPFLYLTLKYIVLPFIKCLIDYMCNWYVFDVTFLKFLQLHVNIKCFIAL